VTIQVTTTKLNKKNLQGTTSHRVTEL